VVNATNNPEQSASRPETGDGFAASTGLPLTGAGWLDVHMEAYRPEYEAMLAWAGLQPGWRVLDAGCGSGSFVQLIAGHVGATGSIVALDPAPDSIEVLHQRLTTSPPACPVLRR
jgi:2-polyprenyl-3-methyl-5-hydroxy-6-metoxy-1,4-benzoquinol methylase